MTHLLEGKFGGLKPSPPDHRDFHYVGGQFLKASPTVDITRLEVPADDQKATSSCTGQSAAELRGALARRYHFSIGEEPSEDERFSARQLYWHIRQLDGSVDADNGGSMRSLCRALVQFGGAPRDQDPWSEEEASNANLEWLNTQPSEEEDQAAYEYGRASGFLKLGGTRQTLLNNIWACLGDGYPVALGYTVVESFVRTPASGLVPAVSPGEPVLGAHTTLIYKSEIDPKAPAGGRLWGPNHWGLGWANNGRCGIPWQYVMSGVIFEAWTVR